MSKKTHRWSKPREQNSAGRNVALRSFLLKRIFNVDEIDILKKGLFEEKI